MKADPPSRDAAGKAVLEESAAGLTALREAHTKGVLKRRYTRESGRSFQEAFAPALPVLASRFGHVMDLSRRPRTQPEEERLMRAASLALFDLENAGQAGGLFRESAALAVLTFFVGDYKDALHWVNLAASLDPDEPANKLNGAVLAGEFLDFPLALRLVGEVLLSSPDLKPAWALKARALQGAKLAEEAQAAALEKRGKRKEAHALREFAASRTGDAASALLEVTRLDPADARAFYELGKFLFTKGHLADASKAYARAVALDPALKLAWYQKGACHQMLEEPAAAIEAFERALALDRRDPGGVHFKLAAMHALKAENDRAFAWIASGLALNKANFYSEIYRIEFGPLWGDPRWEALLTAFFADTGFQHTKAAQAEVGFSWGLFEHGSVLFYDSLADAFGAAEAYRREGEFAKARPFYEKLVELLDRDRHPLKAAVVRGRLASLPADSPPGAP